MKQAKAQRIRAPTFHPRISKYTFKKLKIDYSKLRHVTWIVDISYMYYISYMHDMSSLTMAKFHQKL